MSNHNSQPISRYPGWLRAIGAAAALSLTLATSASAAPQPTQQLLRVHGSHRGGGSKAGESCHQLTTYETFPGDNMGPDAPFPPVADDLQYVKSNPFLTGKVLGAKVYYVDVPGAPAPHEPAAANALSAALGKAFGVTPEAPSALSAPFMDFGPVTMSLGFAGMAVAVTVCE